MSHAVEAYRQAAIQLYGLTKPEAEKTFYHPDDDPGDWAPEALVIVNFEQGTLPACDYYHPYGIDERFKLSDRAGVGYVEMLNAAVGAVYDI